MRNDNESERKQFIADLNSPVTNLYSAKKNGKLQHKNATKNFNYTMIANRLRMVSCSSVSTGVVKPVYWIPTVPLPFRYTNNTIHSKPYHTPSQSIHIYGDIIPVMLFGNNWI